MARGGDAGEKNRRWGLKLPRPQNVGARAVKVGGYTTLLGVILVFVAIALNLFVSELPPQFIKFDTSAQKLYTISPQTREVIGKLEQDVILYYISEPSTYDLLIQEMLERYSSLSDRISVQYVNSILYPNFASQYKSGTIYPNSVVVKIGDKSRWVGYEQIFDVIYYTDYSNSNIQYDTVFQGESALTNAISFLVSGNMPVVYNLSGHGEPEMNPDFMSFIERQNIELRDLSLIGGGAVPNDADALILLSPRTDISDMELENVLEYLKDGGNLLLVTDYIANELPNVEQLANSYGLKKLNGLLIDPAARHSMSGYPMNLVPSVLEHEVTMPLIRENYGVAMPACHGIGALANYRDTIKMTPILATSPYAYLKENAIFAESLNLAKEEGDVEDVYVVGMVAVEPNADKEARFIWFSTSEFLRSNYNGISSGANWDLFVNALAWMCGHEDAVTIHAKNISTKYLNINSSQASLLAITFMGVIPAIPIVIGWVIWNRRKKS